MTPGVQENICEDASDLERSAEHTEMEALRKNPPFAAKSSIHSSSEP
jgi:hypothetical protein